MLTNRIEAAKLALKVRGHRSRRINQAARHVAKLARAAPVTDLRRRVEPAYREAPGSAAKYASPRNWLLLNTLRAAELRLDAASDLRILDIGCGPGYFLALARALGHQCQGVDVPEGLLSELERDVYGTMLDALHCRNMVSPLLIERFKPLPFPPRSLDLITAFWICFNRHRQPNEWGVDEWRYFVDGALGCLRAGGRLVLDLNGNPDLYGELCYYDPALRDYFRSVGVVNDGRIVAVSP